MEDNLTSIDPLSYTTKWIRGRPGKLSVSCVYKATHPVMPQIENIGHTDRWAISVV